MNITMRLDEARQLLRKLEARDPNSWTPKDANSFYSGLDKLRSAVGLQESKSNGR